MKSVLLKHNKSGLIYHLWHKQDDAWYISCNDGIVPSGQPVYGDSAKEIADSINCSLVEG